MGNNQVASPYHLRGFSLVDRPLRKVSVYFFLLCVWVRGDTRALPLRPYFSFAPTQKIPYLLVVGGREEESETVNVRFRNGDQDEMSVKEFIEEVNKKSKK